MTGFKGFGFSSQSMGWGAVRRKSFFARLTHTLMMTALGLVALATFALVAIFAGIAALCSAVVMAVMTVWAIIARKPAAIKVRSEQAKAVYEARKSGSTWVVY